ncbi:BrnT family toxin [Rhodoplanes sp. SY1]|uniref:BrnT family toxin n=1 Tax=Rhodoplanes sp. SY1 TaxID=3166646 RepID=UPI0038B573B4
MTDSELQHLFAGISRFGWDPAKRASNLRNHKIDFDDARAIFDGDVFVRRSDRHGETRYQVFGWMAGREIAVACTLRGDLCWIISARRARRDERRKFYGRVPGHPADGQD